MIDFGIRFGITNPWKVESDGTLQKDYCYFDKPISKHKNISFQLSKDSKLWNFIRFSMSFEPDGEDHAGFRFNVSIFRFSLYFEIYDGRHWNYEEDRWMEEKDYVNG